MKRLLLLLTLAIAATAGAQTTNTPLTKYEQFKALPDALLVQGMTTIGTLNNQIQFPVEIRAERIVNQLNTNAVYAVSLRTRIASTAGAVTYVDYIDYDELPALIQSVQLISQSTASVSPMEGFETIFQTRGGLVIKKIGKPAKTVITMTPANSPAMRNQMAGFVLDDFGRYLTAAKAQIDSIIASGQ